MDVLAVLEATQKAIDRARQGKGPTLIECDTYRFVGHSQFDPDNGTNYRSREEIEQWREKDPIPRFRRHLEKQSGIDEETLTGLEKRARQEVEAAAAQALQDEMPAADEAFDDMFADFELPEEQCRD
jgi:TPP-dependent pyruvate/acetoin dehydrogenase alpha subunit